MKGPKGTQWQLSNDAGAVRPDWEINDTPYWIGIDMLSFIMFWCLLVILLIFMTITLKYTCPRLWASVGMAAHTISPALAPEVELMFASLGLIKLRHRVNIVSSKHEQQLTLWWKKLSEKLSFLFLFLFICASWVALLYLFVCFCSLSLVQQQGNVA